MFFRADERLIEKEYSRKRKNIYTYHLLKEETPLSLPKEREPKLAQPPPTPPKEGSLNLQGN